MAEIRQQGERRHGDDFRAETEGEENASEEMGLRFHEKMDAGGRSDDREIREADTGGGPESLAGQCEE